MNADKGTKQIEYDGFNCTACNQDEVRTVVTQIKNSEAVGADGLPSEMFNSGQDDFGG